MMSESFVREEKRDLLDRLCGLRALGGWMMDKNGVSGQTVN